MLHCLVSYIKSEETSGPNKMVISRLPVLKHLAILNSLEHSLSFMYSSDGQAGLNGACVTIS